MRGKIQSRNLKWDFTTNSKQICFKTKHLAKKFKLMLMTAIKYCCKTKKNMQTEEIWCLNCWKINHSLVQWNESTFFVFLSPFLYVLILRHQLSINCFKTLIWIFKKMSFFFISCKFKKHGGFKLKKKHSCRIWLKLSLGLGGLCQYV